MDNASLLVWGMLFGSIGVGFFIYGKKQQKIVPLITGLLLLIFPYFISNIYLLISTGAILIALPYFVRT